MSFASAFSFLTEFGCGYVLLGCFSRLLNLLGMVLMFAFCFKVLRFGWHAKSSIRFLCDYRGIPSIRLCFEKLPVKPPAQSATSPVKKPPRLSKEKGSANSEDGWGGKEENEREVVNENEDEVFDVRTLRKLVKMERRKANAACADLDHERTAASSSAEEAMAMILRLQNEKSSAEIEANQFRRMAEERVEYDQEVIEELHWMITDHETQKGLLEDQLGIYREELKLFVRDEEINQLELDLGHNRGVVGDDPEQDHSEVGDDPEPYNSVVGDNPEPYNSVVEDDPEQQHSVVGDDPEPETSVVGDNPEQYNSVVGDDPEPEHSVVGDDPKPYHSVIEDDPKPNHSVVSSSQTESQTL